MKRAIAALVILTAMWLTWRNDHRTHVRHRVRAIQIGSPVDYMYQDERSGAEFCSEVVDGNRLKYMPCQKEGHFVIREQF
jgi:hypothetical protein